MIPLGWIYIYTRTLKLTFKEIFVCFSHSVTVQTCFPGSFCLINSISLGFILPVHQSRSGSFKPLFYWISARILALYMKISDTFHSHQSSIWNFAREKTVSCQWIFDLPLLTSIVHNFENLLIPLLQDFIFSVNHPISAGWSPFWKRNFKYYPRTPLFTQMLYYKLSDQDRKSIKCQSSHFDRNAILCKCQPIPASWLLGPYQANPGLFWNFPFWGLSIYKTISFMLLFLVQYNRTSHFYSFARSTGRRRSSHMLVCNRLFPKSGRRLRSAGHVARQCFFISTGSSSHVLLATGFFQNSFHRKDTCVLQETLISTRTVHWLFSSFSYKDFDFPGFVFKVTSVN